MGRRSDLEDTSPTVLPLEEERITVNARSRSDDETAFTPRDQVAGRYRITRFIAFGGMGEVYEAEDIELREMVALKTIRPDVADDASILDRFKREILLARRVTHPNVCRIFDLGTHTPAGRATQTFLTMELLAGETLADLIRMGRVFTAKEARPIVTQMCAALDAAHKEGIVHRDFKSGNVMLCPTGKEGGVRVVVTDFGLARGGEGDPFATNAPAGAGMLGSPAYMAPEQVEGTQVGPSADVYALGVVMFEMLTGHVPFTGDTVMACAAKRLKDPAPSPRVYLPDIDPLWERVIMRCLERDPADRYASAGDVERALQGESVAPGRREQAERDEAAAREYLARAETERKRLAESRRRVLWRGIAIAILGVAVVGAGAYVLIGRRGAHAVVAPPAAAVSSRRAVAVLGFKNLSGRQDVGWLSTAFTEMLTTELGAGNELRTIPGESLARMRRDLQLGDADAFAPDTLGRIRANVGADYVVVGSYTPLGSQVRLDVRLQDTASGETLAQIGASGGEDDLAALVGRAGAQLRERLSIGPLSASEQAIVNAALPQNPEAARLYSEGLAKARLYLMLDARSLFERALALEPGFAQAHVALAEALAYLGYEAQAREEAKRAFELAAKLPEDERLGVEGQYYSLNGNEARAAESYGKLWKRFPDSVEWGMRYASAQLSAGDENGGHATIAMLRQLPNAEDDPRLYLVLQQAAIMKQDYKSVRELAAKLAKSGEARGALSLVGEAREAEAVARWFEGDVDGAILAAEEAREVAFTIGDRDGVSASLTTKGWILTENGAYAAAKKAAEDALDVAAQVGSRRRIWPAEHVLARVGFFTGDLVESRRRYEASQRAAVEVGSKYGEALAKLGLAVVDGLAGELEQAKPLYAELSVGFRLFAPRHNMAFLLHYYGDLQVELGDLGAARKSYEEALAIRREIGEEMQAQRDAIALGMLALVEDKPAEAEKLAREALPFLDGHKLANDAASARAVIARALAAQGKPEAAQGALGEAMKNLEGSESFLSAMDVAWARGALAKPEAARQIFEEAAARATSHGYLGYAYEMRLARARVLAATGKKAAAKADMAALATESAQRGFARVARLAGELAK